MGGQCYHSRGHSSVSGVPCPSQVMPERVNLATPHRRLREAQAGISAQMPPLPPFLENVLQESLSQGHRGWGGVEGWGWGAVLHFPWDSKLWAYSLCRCLTAPLHDIQAQPSLAFPPPPLPPCPHPIPSPNLGLLAFEGTMSRPGSASGRIWSRSGNHPSSGSSPEIGVGEVLPACQLWVGVCEAPGAMGLLLKSLAQFSESSTLAPEEGRPGSHAGLPGRKSVVPRWPQDKAGYIAAKGGVWVQSQMAGKKGLRDRKAPGTGPMGAPKQATRAGVQWVVRPSALSQGLSPRAPQSPALCLGQSWGGQFLTQKKEPNSALTYYRPSDSLSSPYRCPCSTPGTRAQLHCPPRLDTPSLLWRSGSGA